MDKSVFLRVMGDSPVNRVLDFMVIHQEFDYSMTDIAKLSGVGYSTLKLFWHNLEKGGIVVHTRTVGKAMMYRLNLENPAVRKFEEFYWTITKKEVHESLSEKVVAH